MFVMKMISRKLRNIRPQMDLLQLSENSYKSLPNLSESTVRPCVKKYKINLKEKAKQWQNSNFTPTIGNARGRPLLLNEELDLKLRTMILTFRAAGTNLYVYVVRSVLNGLVCANPKKSGKYIDFQVNRLDHYIVR